MFLGIIGNTAGDHAKGITVGYRLTIGTRQSSDALALQFRKCKRSLSKTGQNSK